MARRVELRLDDARELAGEIARTSLDELAGNNPDRPGPIRGHGAATGAVESGCPAAEHGVLVADLTWFRRDVLVGPPGRPRVPGGTGVTSRFICLAPPGRWRCRRSGGARGQERLDAPHHYPDQDEVDRVRVAFARSRGGGGWDC